MLVTTILLTIAVFFIARAIVVRVSKMSLLSTYVGAAMSAALLGGVFLGAHLHAKPAPDQEASAVPASASDGLATAAASSEVKPHLVHLSSLALNRLVDRGADLPGSLDTLNGLAALQEQTFTYGKPLTANGWIAAAGHQPTRGMFLLLDGRTRVDGTASYGLGRPDVADTYSDRAMTLTGFQGVTIPSRDLKRGEHTLQIAGVGADGTSFAVVNATWSFRVR